MSDATASGYDALVVRLREAHLIASIGGLLDWDEQVNLPPGSAPGRARQMALIARLHRNAMADPGMSRLLDTLRGGMADLPPGRAAVVRVASIEHERMTRLPASFVEEKAVLDCEAFHAWAQAREEDDFARFRPLLERQLDHALREAALIGRASNPYDHHIDLHDPGIDAATLVPLFDSLKEGLVPLVRSLAGRGDGNGGPELKDFPAAGQEMFAREVCAGIGFDLNRGRLDRSLHPFCSGDGEDTRLTTRYNADSPLDSVFSAIHEAGHGLYEQGLPAEHAGTALGDAAGMAVHESQSRLWENHVGRSRHFWRHFEPRYRELFPGQLRDTGSEDLIAHILRVRPGPIRVEADEVTYNLHILLRFDLERRLFSGALSVRELPDAWRALSMELLGLEPGDDREGVLQDVHWSSGAFGYFPSYCLGSMIAAQLWEAAMAAMPAMEEDFARGDFSGLLGWLRREVHSRARIFETPGLVRLCTGSPPGPGALLRHLRSRYAQPA